MTDTIERLAEAAGILTAYHDIHGTVHSAPRSTLEALLAALGFGVETETDLAHGLAMLADEDWGRLTPSVHVVRADRPAPVAVCCAAPAAAVLSWQVTQEDGTVIADRKALADLPVLATGTDRHGRVTRRALALPPAATAVPGYHRLELAVNAAGWGELTATLPLIVAPARAPAVRDAANGRAAVWGLAGQLYSLRRSGDWGLGDFTALGDWAAQAGKLGADVFGLSPCHALFWAEPRHFSPYGPSSRRFLNPMHLDVEAIPELSESPAAQALLLEPRVRAEQDRLRAVDRIDYAAVGALKRQALETLFADFCARHLVAAGATPRGAAFLRFQAAQGRSLEDFARFEALHEHFYAGRGLWSWRDWPAAYRDPDTPEVADFAAAHAERVRFFAWLQWLSAEQLEAAAGRARAAGADLGLYGDLAVAEHPDGASAWAHQGVVTQGARVGAPPDPFNAAGQNWGLAPLNPLALRASGYRLFIETVRACMKPCGVLRLDHAMGLERLFWVPAEGGPGTYVRFPFDDLVNIVCLEAARQGCVVVGEDLGTVSPEFRAATVERGILSYRVLYFERDADGAFKPPATYPEQALATADTHDLPTLAGFWLGRDWTWRRRLGLFPDEDALRAALAERALDRLRLIDWLEAAGVVAPGRLDPFLGPDQELADGGLTALVARALARVPSALVMATLEDLFGMIEQPNLPGTVAEHPNWCRRLPGTADDLAAAGASVVQALAVRRG